MSRFIKFRNKKEVDIDRTIVTNQKGEKLGFDDFKDDTIILPKKSLRKHLAIILKENDGAVFRWVSKKLYRFSVDQNTYFNTKGSGYITDNNIIVSVYLEGIPIAISHKIVKTETITKDITLIDGTEKTVSFNQIEGVKIDSKVIDFLLNRGLADEFTEKKLVLVV